MSTSRTPTWTSASPRPRPGAVAAVRNAEVDLDAHVIRAGVNFKFGGLGGF